MHRNFCPPEGLKSEETCEKHGHDRLIIEFETVITQS
jgi:hypothetical protein